MRCLKGITPQQVADGLQKSLDRHPEWPPGAAQFRSLCLSIDVDNKGREITRPAGIYNTEPTEAMKFKKALSLESDEQKERRESKAKNTLDSLTEMFP